MSKLEANILTIDVEDWFHILATSAAPDLSEWNRLESRVERNTQKILDYLDEAKGRATFFFLGWVAEKCPGLVREVLSRGHEIGCHGYDHRLVCEQSQQEFAQDIMRAKSVIEQSIGARIDGYRAPGFSITHESPWAFDEIAAAGFRYDSSVFPAGHGHGGLRQAQLQPHILETTEGRLLEFPISVVSFFGKRICFFGGGYLRLFPFWMTSLMSNVVARQGRPLIYYLHPREVDPGHPRLDLDWQRSFRSYVNLAGMPAKLQRLLRCQPTTTFRDWIDVHRSGITGSCTATALLGSSAPV